MIPPRANAAFVAAMEDVLDVYTRPRDPARPLVCLDETSKQLTKETRAPVPMQSGQPARLDYEYARRGVASLFMGIAPLEGWRHVAVRDRRTAIDYAHVLKDLADVYFPTAEKITLVQDNLNTHKPASLCEAFPPTEARRIADRFAWHYTPKHGSWLNIAECELSVLSRQCLARRIPDKASLGTEVTAWAQNRNNAQAKTNWHFTSEDAHNLILVGGTGTGKTHIAIALRTTSINQGKKARFFNSVDLINALIKKQADGNAGKIIRQLTPLDCVIIDELGYIPLPKSGGALLFLLISKLYEKPVSSSRQTWSSGNGSRSSEMPR